jgi:hypothetical protein
MHGYLRHATALSLGRSKTPQTANITGQSFCSIHTVGSLHARDAHLPDFLQTHATLRRLLDVLETDLRLEILGLGCLLNDTVELVDLLEGQAFRLVDKEPNESDTDETK